MKDLSDRIAALTPQQRAMFELLRKRQAKKAAAGPPPGAIPRRSAPGPAPLSFDQERLWFLHQLDPRETAYNLATVTRIRGPLDMRRLIAALNEVVRRHEAWRTVLPAVDGLPVQVVLPRLELGVPLLDLRQIPDQRRQALALEIARREAHQPFDFDRGPLLRAGMIRLAPEEHFCVLVVHHIVTDWISSQIAWGELAAIYPALVEGRPSPLPEPPIQYADFAVWQREWLQGEALERYLDFWVEEIAGAPHVLELPIDRPRPPFQTTRGAQARLRVPADRTEALRALARQERATSFMSLLAVYGALLHRLTGEAKILISAPNANRNRAEIQQLIGFFLTQVVFAVDLSGDPTFRELLLRVRGTALRAFAHQDLPFGKLVEAVRPERDPSRAPLVQVNLLVLDADASSSLGLLGLAFEKVPLEEEVARFDLSLGIWESSQGIDGFIEHNRDLFDATTAARLARAFERLVEQVGSDPELRVSQLGLLDEGALHQVLCEWNDTAVPEPAPLVHQLVAGQAARAPQAVALVTPEGETTYAELERRAGLLAAWLGRQGIGRGARVGLCLERTADLAAGMLGVWKAEAAWVPLDPAYPADRLAWIAADAGLSAIVSRDGLVSRLPETPLREAAGEGLAYVIYTSGTTGTPKGVMVEHGSLAHALRASRREFGWTAADRIPVLAPFSFDIFLFELWSPLTAGGTAELVPLAPALDLPRLLAGLEQATRLHAVPALMRQIVALARAEGRRWPGVRTVFVGGDAVPPELLAELPEVFPAAEIRVLYGPTEGTIICASLLANEIPWRDHGPKTLIGRPLPGAELRLVDRSGGLAAIGVAGEIWIGGPGVTRGYLGREELTAEKYVEREGRRWYRTGDLARWLPDGVLEFLGRVDEQVKVRGFRIEPGEIEAALLEQREVREAVVLAVPVEAGDKRLVAYVVPEGPWEEIEEALRAALARRLPEHMVPAAFVPLVELPLTAHGKVDRRALAKLGAAAAPSPVDATAPRTPAEEALAEIWRGLLGVERVGVHDNFFRLGGDSILGIQVVARARQAGLTITPRQIFENQTVAALAAVARPVTLDAAPEEGPVEGEAPLTPVQLRFLAEDPVDPEWFNQALLLDVRQPVDPGALARALAVLAERHDALRWTLTPGPSPASGRGVNSAQIRPVAMIPFLEVDLSALPGDAFSPTVTTASAQLQTGFDLQYGRVFLVALFSRAASPRVETRGYEWPSLQDGGDALQTSLSRPATAISSPGFQPGAEGRLLLAAHHLIVDAVSWRILLEDLQTTVLPPRTTSWKRWAERLAGHARSEGVREELEHWLALPVPAALPAELPGDPEDDTVGMARVVSVELPPAATAALLREAPAPYHARVDDLLLTALAQAFSRWTGEPRLVLELEGHGREESVIGGGIDLSRTVGWFTTVFPVALDLAEARGPGEAIKAVKEQLRAVPGKGLGYGLLRYFGGVAGDDRLAVRPEPEVGFNYLGQLDAALPAGGAFAPAPEPAGPTRSPRARRRHRIDVDALVWEGRLRIDVTYASRLFSRETMERLAQGLAAALEELIAHCLSAEAGGWTPSDFPLARLDQAALDALVGTDPAIEDLYPLAPLQKVMLLHGIYEPDSAFYLEQLTCVLRGGLDVEAFRLAWQRVVDRHPALRTAFAWQGLDEPLQVVRRGVELPWETEDWRGLPEEERPARWKTRIATDGRQVFDLARPPLQRVLLVRTADDEHRFLWSCHHLLFDGWCFALIFRDVFQVYEAIRRGGEPRRAAPRPYRDFIAWLAEHPVERSEEWWRQRLAGFTVPTPLPLDLPVARPGEPGAAEPGELGRRLTPDATAGVAAFAQNRRLTLNTLFQGAWALLLTRYGAGRDVVSGCVVAGRPPDLPGVESMIGLFINTLPLRLDVDPDAPAAAWLQGVQEAQLDLHPHEHVPLADVQGWSELPPGEPLFRSLAVFENYPFDESLGQGAHGLEVRELTVLDRADLPLSAMAAPASGGLSLRIAHDHRTGPATVERLLQHLETLLLGLAADPDRPLRDIPLLSAAERGQLLAWGEEGWRIAGPAPEEDLPVHALFARRAAERPEAPALLGMDGTAISYGDLAQRVARLAGSLRELGVGPEARVGVRLERSPRMVEAVLAVHVAGGAYVPIDPEAPPERVALLLEDSGALLVLTQDSLAATLPPVAARVVLVEHTPSLEPSLSLESFASLDHLAYVLYTSGSTGTPKGVLVSHRSLAAYVRAICGIYAVGPADRAIQFASLSFDASAEEIFTALASGASLVVRSGPVDDAATFLRRCSELGLTLLSLPTAYWHQLAEAEWPAGVRLVVMGGERALPERWAAWGRGPGRRPRLFNAYGPTEATIAATLMEHPGGALTAQREVPIGRPLPGWRAHVLDAGLRPLPVGAAGELFLGGAGLARGYLGDPARTAERFVPDPLGPFGERLYRTGDRARRRPDGTLEFAGRIDTQVKVRGFRIELGEVEAALGAHPEVREAAAATRVDPSGNARLVAFVVWRDAEDLGGLLASLQRRLPAWMVPSEILALPELPVTATGKLDRRALERLAPETGGAREVRPPRNAVEEGLAEIWSELLGVERVGLDDDFFALGGHSLLATQLVSRVRQRFGVELPLHGLFELRTLEDLAREVLSRTLEAGEEGGMDHLLAELDDLSDEEALALLADEEGAAGEGP